jgi:sugar lactone lactonase YvrE
MKVDVAVPGTDILGECPLWDERSRTLWWVDSRGPAIKCLAPGSGTVDVRFLPEAIGSIAFCESGSPTRKRICRTTDSTTAAVTARAASGPAP